MRKITMTLLGLVAFSTSALAQQEVKFGPKAGITLLIYQETLKITKC